MNELQAGCGPAPVYINTPEEFIKHFGRPFSEGELYHQSEKFDASAVLEMLSRDYQHQTLWVKRVREKSPAIKAWYRRKFSDR